MPAVGAFCVLILGLAIWAAIEVQAAKRAAAERALREHRISEHLSVIEACKRRMDEIAAEFASLKASASHALDHALKAQIEVGAMMKSTHQIQFVEAQPTAEEKALNEALRKNDMDAFSRLSGDLHDDSEPLM